MRYLNAKLHHRFALAKAAMPAALVCLAVTGCSGGLNDTQVSKANVSVVSQGRVMGGQQPIGGATIQLYAVSTSAAGGAATPLITATVTSSDGTGVGGNAGNNYNTLPVGDFIISNMYTCPSAALVYLTATGGNAGAGNNTGLALMAALGPCSGLNSNTYLNINELTTVAAVYALSPFMTDILHAGAAASNSTGVTNAFRMAGALVNFQSGTIATASAGLGVPTARLNTLADILAACVNGASAAASSACTTLFSATGATDTIGAGLAMAKNPGSSAITALFSLVSGLAPFQPSLTTQPNDFTLSVTYSGAEIESPGGVAIDAGGNAWVTNEGGFSVVKLPSLSSSFATTAYNSGGLISPRGISIDRTGNVWIANTGGNTVVELNSSGSVLSGTGYTGGGVSAPVAIANDSAGNAWVANSAGNSVTEFNSTGTPSGTSPITGGGVLSTPTAVAVGPSGQIAVANAGTGQLCLFSNAAVVQSCVSDGYLFGSTGVAVSSGGSIAMSGSTTGATVTGAFTLVTSAGAVSASSPLTGGGLTLPMAVAYDGNGTAWFANTTSISAFSGATSITPAAGLGSLNAPVAIAVDSSGNIWAANSGDNSITVFVGLASPVTTPIAVNAGP